VRKIFVASVLTNRLLDPFIANYPGAAVSPKSLTDFLNMQNKRTRFQLYSLGLGKRTPPDTRNINPIGNEMRMEETKVKPKLSTPKHPIVRNIRVLLTKGFSEEELRRFCFDEPAFRPVLSQLPRNSSKSDIIDRLLEFAELKGQIPTLLTWAMEENPTRYREHEPYYNVHSPSIPDSKLKDHPPSSKTGATTSGKFKYNAFISHASEDRPVVEQIIQDFRRAGVTYWVDHEQIDFGDRITEKIEEGLRESKYVVVCLSANLGRSNWVRAEYGSILHKELGRSSQGSGRKVIPLKLDDSSDDEIPLLLYDKRRAHYSNVTEFNQLLEFLKS
jgi:hypothetical protein